jgi:hypothetical protein
LETHAGTLETHAGTLETHAGRLEAHTGTLEQLKNLIYHQEALLNVSNARPHELHKRIHRLERKIAKGPLHLRQLMRHPKAFANDVIGLNIKKRDEKLFPHLKDGFVDENRWVYLSLLWMLRQPKKSLLVFLRQPRKVFAFVCRHPKKFLFSGKSNHGHFTSSIGTYVPVVDSSNGINTGKCTMTSLDPVLTDDLSPSAQRVYRDLKKAIEIRR